MERNDLLRRLGRTGAAGVLATMLAASAEAALPTGGMMEPRPRGPARADLPSSTSISATRIPSAAAYGIAGQATTFAGDSAVADGTSAGENPFEEVLGEAPVPLMDALVSSDAPALLGEGATEAIEFVSVDREGADFGGLEGICPVTLRDERRSVTPRPELFVMHAGRRYEFATPEAQAAFEADPERYAPALGGRDVVLTTNGTEDAIGSLKHAGFYRERLYLFQTDESYKAFYENPQKFLVGE